MDAALKQPLFARVLGAEFESLPAAVRQLHLAGGHRRYRGHVQVLRGTGLLSRVCAWAARLPPAGEGALEVEIESSGASEKWTRHIGGRPMPSRLWQQDGLLCEQLGLVRFGFALQIEREALVWRVQRARVLGLGLPAHWFGKVLAFESEAAGRYRFDVAASLPAIGLLAHYQGWLHVD